jgi:hypothetical protein
MSSFFSRCSTNCKKVQFSANSGPFTPVNQRIEYFETPQFIRCALFPGPGNSRADNIFSYNRPLEPVSGIVLQVKWHNNCSFYYFVFFPEAPVSDREKSDILPPI